MKPDDKPIPLDELTARFPAVGKSAATAARSLLGPGRENLVEEITNDVLLLLWKHQRAGNLPEKPEFWAHTVARNRARKIARIEGRYVTGLLENESNGTGETVQSALLTTDPVTPADNAELSDRLRALKRLLDAFDLTASTGLNERERRLFDLVYRKRLTGLQVAQELGVAPEVARKQWSRLLTRLLYVVRLQLQADPLCGEMMGTLLNNEETFRRTLVKLLRLLLATGVQELEKLVKATLRN